MATGDIISAEVRAGGYLLAIKIEGWGADIGSVTYNEKSNAIDAAASDVQLAITSPGYVDQVLTTRARTSEGTVAAWLLAASSGADETNDAGDLVVEYALSEPIYVGDTAVTVTIASGWANNGGGSNAVAGLSVTNSSTLGYPKCGLWWSVAAHRGGWRYLTADLQLAATAKHMHGIDSVQCSAIGATSSNAVSGAGSLTSIESVGSGLFHETFSIDCPLSGFTAGEQMDIRFIAYPKIGTATEIVDTDTNTDINSRVLLNGKMHHICDKDHAVDGSGHINAGVRASLIAFANKDSGDNTTGVVGTAAAAAANMYEDHGSAFNDGALVVYVQNSTAQPNLVAGWGNNTAPQAYIEVTEDPNDPGVYLNAGTASDDNYRQPFYCYTNIGIQRASGSNAHDGENGNYQLLFDGVDFDTTTSSSAGYGYRSKMCTFLNCTGMGNENYNSFSTARGAYVFWGNDFSSGGGTNSAPVFVNNECLTDNLSFFEQSTSNPAPAFNNILCYNNNSPSRTINGSNNEFVRLGDSLAVENAFIVGNIVAASTVVASGPNMWCRGDGSIQDCHNVHFWNNTVAGSRNNMIYNDQGSLPASTENTSIRNNALQSMNIKGSNFGTPDAGRSGNRNIMLGVSITDNAFDGSAGSSFTGQFSGVGSVYELSGTISTFGELGYVDEGSVDGTGLGGGDYTPDTGSVLMRTAAQELVSCDLFGTSNGSNVIGGVFIAASGGGGGVWGGNNLSIGIGIGVTYMRPFLGNRTAWIDGSSWVDSVPWFD